MNDSEIEQLMQNAQDEMALEAAQATAQTPALDDDNEALEALLGATTEEAATKLKPKRKVYKLNEEMLVFW